MARFPISHCFVVEAIEPNFKFFFTTGVSSQYLVKCPTNNINSSDLISSSDKAVAFLKQISNCAHLSLLKAINSSNFQHILNENKFGPMTFFALTPNTSFQFKIGEAEFMISGDNILSCTGPGTVSTITDDLPFANKEARAAAAAAAAAIPAIGLFPRVETPQLKKFNDLMNKLERENKPKTPHNKALFDTIAEIREAGGIDNMNGYSASTKCPILLTMMTDPMIDEFGRSCENGDHLKTFKKCPITKQIYKRIPAFQPNVPMRELLNGMNEYNSRIALMSHGPKR